MKYLSTSEIATKWNVSERSVRNYCNQGRVIGAILNGKTWIIPDDAKKPTRKSKKSIKIKTLLDILLQEKESKTSGGIYHKLQIEMTYNSNHIEGSRLTHDQTRYIYETRTIGFCNENLNVDDIIETSNHFRCVDLAIESAKYKLTESLIKQFHFILKSGTSDSNKAWFKIGDYKMLDNEVGGTETCLVQNVKTKMMELLKKYNSKTNVTIEDIIDFHYEFEKIHPFQDGNGRVGRLIMLKECLKNNIVPVIINEDLKYYYYRGLKEYKNEKGYLIDTCLFGQNIVKKYLDYFKIAY
ncbi:MAG: Fic family protein [Anaeroplasmataceae bacterium]